MRRLATTTSSGSIGVSRPISVSVYTFDAGKLPDEAIRERLRNGMDFRPGAIEHRFALRARAANVGDAGFFKRLAVYGQVGRIDLDLPWEKTDIADALAGA